MADDEPLSPSLLFGWVDYLIFALSLAISSFVGIYHAWRGSGSSTSNYLLGGKSMAVFPIAMSLAASTVSTTAMLGMPTDVYMTGTMYWWTVPALFIGVPIAAYVYLPLYHQLEIVSINQYLELRFNRIVRRLSCVVNLTQLTLFFALLTYGPSLALAQVTGLEVYVCCAITFAVCTFYTTIGGIKAVVWTDTIQIFLMMASVILLITKGVIDIGLDNVWERNVNTSRIEFLNFNPDPTIRHTFWGTFIGFGIYWIGFYATGQGSVQRFLSVPTKKDAQWAFLINILGVAIFTTLCIFSGLVAYATYFDCDPLSANLIKKADQLIPYFVMDCLGSLPGLPGLFVAGIFSASLSSLSTYQNSAALIILEDFIRPFFTKLSDKSATRITKCISFSFGCFGFGFVFLISNIKAILDAAVSVSGAGFGASLGIFTLGMFVPWANSIGAGISLVVGYVSVMCLGVNTQIALADGLIKNPQVKPISTENCPDMNSTLSLMAKEIVDQPKEAFILLRISYIWYTTIGMFIVLILGTLISFITCPQDPGHLDPKLVCRFIQGRVGYKRGVEEGGEIVKKSYKQLQDEN